MLTKLTTYRNVVGNGRKTPKEKDLNYKKTKHYFDRLIKEDQFKDLTLTYDFEAEVAKIKRTPSV